MNAKDLRTETALGAHINDGSTKYAQSGNSLQNNSNKSYQDIGAHSLAKVDVQTSRPCAIIGPDRILPSPNCNDGFVKKIIPESWPCSDNMYRQPPDYPHKMPEYQPTRNISPRQTFQENMQRIMVAPYSSAKKGDESNFPVDRNITMLKNVKSIMPSEAKYCEVPYTISPACNEQKNHRVAEIPVTHLNAGVPRNAPHGWPPNNVNLRPVRPYGAPELYQYSDYPSCAGPRPMPMIRPHRTVQDDPGRLYPEQYYQDANVRFRPYPSKGRYPPGRYDYISNYTNSFHPPFPPHGFEPQKSGPSHSYPVYPQVPIKYIDRRMGDPIIDGYQRHSPQANLNLAYRNQIIHPPYGPLQPNCIQNNIFPYPSDSSKSVISNKLPYSNNHNNKIYIDYDASQNKKMSVSDSVYSNDANHTNSMKGEVVYPNYPPVNIHGISQLPLYRKENVPMKNLDYVPHLRNLDSSVNFHSPLLRHPIHFSPTAYAISPSDSNTSNDTTQTHATQEDCGYVSQSSTASGRSGDSHINGFPNDHHTYRSPDYRYGFLPRNVTTQGSNNGKSSKVKKDLNVRQFLQMWNEGDDEPNEQNKEETLSKSNDDPNNLPHQFDSANKQEQLYVLGLVNVPSEELGKYEHIQKISKLPENIKGYNNIELLNQFEEAIESTNMRMFNLKPQKEYHTPIKSTVTKPINVIPRPVSPLDVEAKISQSVIHKEVGCNFEIKPCSPKMLNVEIATPIHNILDERIIEKVSNPIAVKPIGLNKTDKIDLDRNFSNAQNLNCENSSKEIIGSCSMDNLQCRNDNSVDPDKQNFNLQYLEYSSVCLASLPRLDNDVEFNFPEINQQFINANNIESVNSPSYVKDLPILDSDQKDKNNTKNNSKKTNEITHVSPNVETENNVTKLSKYRKLRKSDVELKPSQLSPSTKTQFRTDSVIIKNPDMIKTHGSDCSIVSDCITNVSHFNKKLDVEIKDNKITSPYTLLDVTADEEHCNVLPKIDNHEMEKPVDIAIDFSLNKSENESMRDCPLKETTNINDSLLNLIDVELNISEAFEKSELSALDSNNISNENEGSKHGNDKTNLQILSYLGQEEITKKILVSECNVTETKDECKSVHSQNELIYNSDSINLNSGTETGESILDTNVTETKEKECDSVHPQNKLIYNSDSIHLSSRPETDESIFDTNATEAKDEDCNSVQPKNKLIYNSDSIHLSSRPETNESIFDTNATEAKDEDCNSVQPQNKLIYNSDSVHLSSGTETGESILDTNATEAKDEDCNTVQPQNELIYYSDSLHLSSGTETGESILDTNATEAKDEDCNSVQPQNELSYNSDSIHLISRTETGESALDTNLTEAKDEDCNSVQPQNEFSYNSDSIHLSSRTKTGELTLDTNATEAKDEDCNSVQPQNELSYNSDSIHLRSRTETGESTLDTNSIEAKDEDRNSVQAQNEFSYNSDSIHLSNRTETGESILETNIIEAKDDECYSVQPQNELIYNSDSANLSSRTEIGESILDTNVNKINNYLSEENHNTQDSMSCKDTENVTYATISQVQEADCIGKDSDHIMEKFQESYLSIGNDFESTIFYQGISDKQNVQIDDNSLMSPKYATIAPDVDSCNNDSEISYIKFKVPQSIPEKKHESNVKLLDTQNISKIENIKGKEVIEVYKPLLKKNSHCNKRLYSSIIQNLIMLSEWAILKENKSILQVRKSLLNEGNITDANSCISVPMIDDCINDQATGEAISNPSHLVSTDSSKTENISIHKTDHTNSDNDKRFSHISDDLKSILHDMPKCLNSASVNIEFTSLEFVDSSKVCGEEHSNTIYVLSNKQSSETPKLESNEIHCNKIVDKLSYCKVEEEVSNKPQVNIGCRGRLKRSLSDSALNIYSNEDIKPLSSENMYSVPRKRKKVNPCEMVEPQLIAENLCDFIQTNRRNSISTLYDEENVSFCILIDNSCVLTEENESQKICLAEISEDTYESEFKSTYSTENIIITSQMSDNVTCRVSKDISQSESVSDVNNFVNEHSIDQNTEGKTFDEESWIEDVACMETVFSDNIAENVVLDEPSSPSDGSLLDYETDEKTESLIYNDTENIEKIKYIYGNEMCTDDAELVETLYRTPQMDVKKTLTRRESHNSDESNRYYDNESLEKVLSESNDTNEYGFDTKCISNTSQNILKSVASRHDTLHVPDKLDFDQESSVNQKTVFIDTEYEDNPPSFLKNPIYEPTQYDTVHSCESTCDSAITYYHKDGSPQYSNSSSPEVSSTTSEEKSCGILLKITKCNGSISSQINEFNTKSTSKISSKLSENKELVNYGNISRTRPLLTKAAQKYIPPLKETIRHLKVKLPLPQNSLNKLKLLKIAKDKPKPEKPLSKNNDLLKHNYPKKNKPKFEDVLKSIDEIQIKMHKEKNKKQKHSIPKVVIKKNENGSHYASTSKDSDTFNPDLTGRKWQPWVFIEKNYFVDKMALNKKVKAVYSHRKNTFVLAEKFRKYKSINNAKFIITPPKLEDISSGKLKYTIRLKHNY